MYLVPKLILRYRFVNYYVEGCRNRYGTLFEVEHATEHVIKGVRLYLFPLG